MKKLSKRIISLLITLAIIVTILPSSIMAKELKENSQKTTSREPLKIIEPEINPEYIYYLDHPDEFKYGYIPQKYLLPFDKSSELQFRSSSENLPKQFKTDLNFVTPVKNQFMTGTCWAHSALSTVETLILRQTDTTKGDLNLSEGHLALNSSRGYNLNSGGNNYAAWRYFSTLAGPVSEKNFPSYTITSDFNGSGLNLMADSKGKHHEYYIAEAKEYENTTENIKRAVHNNYSVTSGYYYDKDNKGADKNDSKKYHFIKKEEVTIKKGEKEEKKLVPITNHQVTIVGWDDEIEIENKNGEKAKGAFLVKNSWGTDNEDNKDNKDQIDKGYYWISYASFPSENSNNLLVFTKVEKRIDNAKNVYTYPDANVPNSIGCMKFKNSPVSIINVFNRGNQDPEEITKVNLYNSNANGMSYTLYISQDGDLVDSNKTKDFTIDKQKVKKSLYETKGNWEKISEGHINDRGYATIDLAKAYKLDKKTFALRLDITSSDNITYVNYSPIKNYPPVKVYNDFGYKNSYISYGNVNKDRLFLKINDDEHNEHNYLDLNAITRAVSQSSLTIEEPEKAWEATEGYDLEKLEPLVLKVVNNGNVRLSDMGFDLLGDDKDKFEIVNKKEDLYLPSLEKGKSLEVKIKPKEVLTLEDVDKVFNLKLSVEAKGIEKPVTKDFTFKLKLDQKARKEAIEKAKEKEAEEAVNNLVTSGENASVEDIEKAQKLIYKLKDESKKLELQNKLNDVVKLTELKAAKEKAIEAIKDLSKIEGEKQSFIDRVNKASKVEDVNSILEEAKNLSKERMTEEEKLNNARGVAITSINATNMPDLTNEEREGFENKIKSAETIDAVNAIVKNAQNKNNENHRVKAELAEKRTQAKEIINVLPNIEKEKDGFISEIETAKDLASVESVVQRAKEKSSENTAKIKVLEDAKIEAKGKISSGNMPDLTDEERQGFEKEIKEARTIEEVNQVVANAKAKNQDNKNAKDALNKAKADAVDEIEKMEFLDPTEKADFKNKVNPAKNTSEVEDIKKAAEARNTEKKAEKEENDKIEKAKTALENLEKNENPSASDIQNVQGLIDLLKNGETKENLQKRLDPIKASNELKLLKDDAIREIKNLTNIEDLKEAFIQEINEAKDKNSVNEILNKAKKKSQEATKLIEEKNKAVKKIKGLENLKEEEKSGFLAKVETVTSLDSLKGICLNANKKNANNLLNSKSLEDLTEDERKAAEKKIEEAKTEEEIKTIIKKAKEQATINKEAAKSLADAKEAAIKLIGTDKMPELSSEERRGFEDRIKNATSLKEVKEIQAEASSINSTRVREKNLNRSKAEAVRELDKLDNLSVNEIQTYKDKISNAGSSEEVERILEEAKNLDLINKNNKINEERERESRREDSKTHFWFNSFPKHQVEVEKTKVTPQAPILKQKEKVETKKFVYKFAIGKTKFTENNDGLNKTKELDVAPFIENGRTMLPLRAIAESIGIKVGWEHSTRTAIFTNGDLVARIQIDGNKVILSDGRVLVLDAKPKIVKNRIVLPITNVSQIFGLTNGNTNDGMKNNIEWDNETKSVIISVNK
ncbi:stalk domain-containing protein [Peptoniphilus vaginalis]|uniref:stalk domain-containing protein n=1 Tax=Peptoniphilus vaginalis TaxID=1756987 RepID=UPI0023F85740|nr:stalk domain-containing protein [Peptoniphilus vaginalis]